MFDRKGSIEQVYQNFSTLAGCSGGDIACLRGKDTDTLLKANQKLNDDGPSGGFVVGPSTDGSLIRQAPQLELVSGNYYKGLDSLLVSHTSDESTLFVDGHVRNDADFTQFLHMLFPSYAQNTGLNAAIETQYPPVGGGDGPYETQGDRVRAFVRDSSFTCNARYLAEAFSGRSYAMQYSITPGWHATDLLPTFWSTGLAASPLGTALGIALPFLSAFSFAYKSYLTSFARSGDPNTHRARISVPLTINWPVADVGAGERIGNVVNAGNLGFRLINDDTNQKQPCGFWVDLLAGMTTAGGYAPPGSVVPTTLLNDTSGASDNYG